MYNIQFTIKGYPDNTRTLQVDDHLLEQRFDSLSDLYRAIEDEYDELGMFVMELEEEE